MTTYGSTIVLKRDKNEILKICFCPFVVNAADCANRRLRHQHVFLAF